MSDQKTYDAIVIGSGISGGWAAKELCEQGLKTLVLERGRMVEHLKDYPNMNNHPWEFKHRGYITQQQRQNNPLISKAAGYSEDTQHFFIEDADHPYVQEKPFDWIRGYQVGGKSLTWGRSCQRWSDFEFNAPKQYGFATDWPIRYKDIAPWYSHVEKFIGVCGSQENIPAMPDGEFLPAYELNCVEADMKQLLWKKFKRHFISGRWAHLTQPEPIHLEQGRGTCQNRNLCMRGCPFGGYFSSNNSTLPWAEKTGNLTIRPHSVVHSILYDDAKQKAIGVRVIDSQTKAVTDYFARIIFANASALNTNLILLNSKSERFPNGLGNDHDLLGRYICFHNYRGYMNGEIKGYEDKYYKGRRPAECVIPNFRNLGKQETDFVGGYTIFSGAYREWINADRHPDKMGAELKEALTEPGPWRIYMYMQGETIPKATNRVYLHPTKKDQWGIPLLVTDVDYDENDEKMLQDFLTEGKKMLEACGAFNIVVNDTKQPPGLDIHEMGGVRMGTDPSDSMLNEWNQLHLCKNVFVTDGACMTSTGNQSPSILYMAFTARAAQFAAAEMKKGNL